MKLTTIITLENFKKISIVLMFLIGLLFTLTYSSETVQEAFEGNSKSLDNVRCPNILVQNGSKLYLYNNKIAKIPGVNPIQFNNLEEYVEFTEWQRSQGIRCPILFLQHTNDPQGKSVYKIRPSPTDLKGGLPPSSTFKVLNDVNEHLNSPSSLDMELGSYPSFDPSETKAWHIKSNASG